MVMSEISPFQNCCNLIYRPKLNHSRTVSYLSLRTWNSQSKAGDLAEFKRVKAACDAGVIEQIATEITAFLQSLCWNSQVLVTAPPPGASAGRGLPHFASLLAAAVAVQLGARYLKVFADRPRTGGSSPKTFNKRGELVIENVPDAPVILLLDDVATSGTTMEECSQALGAFGVVIPLAWIYGEVKDAPAPVDNAALAISTHHMMDLFAVSERTLGNWAQNGCPKLGHGLWPLKEVLTWRGIVAAEEGEESLAQQKLRKEIEVKEEQRKKLAKDNAVDDELYLEKAKIIDELKDYFIELKRSMLALKAMLMMEVNPHVDNDTSLQIDHNIDVMVRTWLERTGNGKIFKKPKKK